MKIIHINCVYPYGSTGKITSQIHHTLLEDGHDSLVIYGRGKRCSEASTIRVCNEIIGKANHLISRFTGLVYGGCILETLKIIRVLKRECPDIVHVQCVNGYFVNIYKLINYLKIKKIKTVITLHAEFMYTANCGCTFGCEKWIDGCGDCEQLYKATESWIGDRTRRSFELMKRSFDGFEDNVKVVGVSDWLSKRAKLSPIMKKLDVVTIYNGINIRCFEKKKESMIKNKLGISQNEKMILWVTSGFTYEKGKDYFEQLIQMCASKKWKYIVVGAKEPENYSGSAVFWGKVSDQSELANLYSIADVALCLSRQESYPTVLVEAQCCGTPVVGFDVGGVKEAIMENMGETAPLGNLELLIKLIEDWIDRKKGITEETLINVRGFFDSRRMVDDYLNLYEDLLEKI